MTDHLSFSRYRRPRRSWMSDVEHRFGPHNHLGAEPLVELGSAIERRRHRRLSRPRLFTSAIKYQAWLKHNNLFSRRLLSSYSARCFYFRSHGVSFLSDCERKMPSLLSKSLQGVGILTFGSLTGFTVWTKQYVGLLLLLQSLLPSPLVHIPKIRGYSPRPPVCKS